ncbi:glycoside hydrolase family 28 protein [Tamlana agarivorans]|uniref:Glycoside hydrolase family 28 protein n=1 Tax=Pseudotamlana agarivorans TaxID=481183 RepID=A0ACC5U9I6_9FLAO|nr:glycoside hydrolase family 28 protein [Tamlana agarivorans]MBU2950941.1 glycoside hydrolase family 28 protein [Tamlana agarivorans]
MKNILVAIFGLFFSSISFAQMPFYATNINFNDNVIDVRSKGAVGDSITLDTKAFQKAIDACTNSGGGVVRVPAGKYHIGTIILKNNVTLSLDFGAHLLGSQNFDDYRHDLKVAREEANSMCLIYAEDASNITIEGLGVIDGRGTPEAFPKWGEGKGKSRKRLPRPRLVRFENCNQVKLSGVTFKRPAFWGVHIVDGTNIHIDGITIRFAGNNVNNDGLDIDGCQNVRIENCDIESGDDGICLKSSLNPCRNYVIRNNIVKSHTSPLKFGTSSAGGFIDIDVSNNYFYDCPMGGIKLELVDGGKMENINISRITMKNVGSPLFIRLGNRGRIYENFTEQIQDADAKPEGAPIGSVKNIRITDLVAEVVIPPVQAGHSSNPNGYTDRQRAQAGPIMIAGIPGHYIENVVLENIEISYPGLGTKEDAKRVVAEDVARYPEQYFFGILPSWGAYIRHAKNVTFKNVKMTTREADKREMIIVDDVDNFINQ